MPSSQAVVPESEQRPPSNCMTQALASRFWVDLKTAYKLRVFPISYATLQILMQYATPLQKHVPIKDQSQ